MKLLIFSDIHGDLGALARLMDTEADYYVAAGDLVNFGRGLDRCGPILARHAGRVFNAVAGGQRLQRPALPIGQADRIRNRRQRNHRPDGDGGWRSLVSVCLSKLQCLDRRNRRFLDAGG